MGPRHSKDDLLVGALDTALADGLSQLTFGRVAKRVGVSDRMVVYYFPTKDALVTEVLLAFGLRLQAELAPAFDRPAADHRDLVRRAWPVLVRPEADGVFGLFFEAMGLAAAGRDPYAALVPQLVEAWISWATELIDAPRARRRAEAEAAIAMIDGLLLLRRMAGPEAAARAVRRLGLG